MEFDYLLKLAVIGDSNAGKTSLVQRYVDNVFSNTYISTIGVDFSIKTESIDGKLVKLQIWDTAGQERFRSITQSYYRGANAIIIVYDITDEASYTAIPDWVERVRRHNDSAMIVIIGTKSDLAHKRAVSKETAMMFAAERNFQYFETSAITADGISEPFRHIASSVLTNCINEPARVKSKLVHLDARPIRQAEKNCCN